MVTAPDRSTQVRSEAGMDSQQDLWWQSEITLADSWASTFEREAELAADEAARADALERAAEARAHAQQLREARAAGWEGPYRDREDGREPARAGRADVE